MNDLQKALQRRRNLNGEDDTFVPAPTNPVNPVPVAPHAFQSAGGSYKCSVCGKAKVKHPKLDLAPTPPMNPDPSPAVDTVEPALGPLGPPIAGTFQTPMEKRINYFEELLRNETQLK
jgi:hypothetical protein